MGAIGAVPPLVPRHDQCSVHGSVAIEGGFGTEHYVLRRYGVERTKKPQPANWAAEDWLINDI